MKKLFTLSLILFLSSYFSLFAVTNGINESVNAYRNALLAYDKMDYGLALKYSEDAILSRKSVIEKEIQTLKNSLMSKAVQNVGDNIDAILTILEKRKEKASVNIINSYLKIKGIDYFNNSIQELLNYMNESMVYPEAQKLIGDIYKLEGEYEFAEEYYQLALKNYKVLDIPDEKYDILYLLADISRLENDYPQMEIRLLNILTEDKFYLDNALNNSMLQTIKSDKKGSMEKYFNLYRANSYLCIDAYNQLSEYYYNENDRERALRFAALSAITSFSKINDILESRNNEYQYSSLSNFFQEASLYEDIVKWGNDNKAWRSFNILAKFTKEMGYNNFSRELLTVLVKYTPEKYWQRDAVLLLEDFEY